jgi:hypothetical protein
VSAAKTDEWGVWRDGSWSYPSAVPAAGAPDSLPHNAPQSPSLRSSTWVVADYFRMTTGTRDR